MHSVFPWKFFQRSRDHTKYASDSGRGGVFFSCGLVKVLVEWQGCAPVLGMVVWGKYERGRVCKKN